MHSFDKNASSVHKKRDNWGQLVKVFKKHGLDVRTREWEAVCASEEGAALGLVGKFHRILAGASTSGRHSSRPRLLGIHRVQPIQPAPRRQYPRATSIPESDPPTTARVTAPGASPRASYYPAGARASTLRSRLEARPLAAAAAASSPPWTS